MQRQMLLLLATDGIYPNDITIVLEVGKIFGYFAIAGGLFKLVNLGRKYYDSYQLHIYEHRLVVQDLFERRPEIKQTFESMVEARAKAVFRPRSRGRGAGL